MAWYNIQHIHKLLFNMNSEMDDFHYQTLRDEFKKFEGRFDHHLAIYARNGKELEAVKTNQAWLMRFFWAFATPMVGGIAYIITQIN